MADLIRGAIPFASNDSLRSLELKLNGMFGEIFNAVPTAGTVEEIKLTTSSSDGQIDSTIETSRKINKMLLAISFRAADFGLTAPPTLAFSWTGSSRDISAFANLNYFFKEFYRANKLIGSATPGTPTPTPGPTPTPTPTPVTKSAPAGFNYNFTAFPITVVKQVNGTYTTDLDPKSRVNSGIWSGATYYVSPTGSNSADGLTSGTAVRSIGVAVKKLMDSAATAGRIFIKSGEYGRENDLVDSANTNGLQATLVNGPTKHIAYLPDPTNTTKPVIGPFFRPTSWTADSGAYITARSAVIRVLFADANGKFTVEATARSSATDVNTGDGWFQDSGNIRIRRPDGAAVTNANTLVIVGGNNFKAGGNNVDIYMEGLEIVGSVSAGLDFRGAATRNVVLVDMDVHHAGSLPSAGIAADSASATGGKVVGQNNFAIDNHTGFVGIWRMRTYGATIDGINAHATTGSLYGLTVDCVGFDNGRNASTSNQGLTLHETVSWIDLNGEYYGNAGGNIRNIGSTQIWGLGVYCHDDRGDVIFGGNTTPADVILNDTSKGWFEDLRCSGTAVSISISSGATVALKNETLAGTKSGVGTYSTY